MCFEGFDWVLLDQRGCYRVVLGFFGLPFWFLMGLARFYRDSMRFHRSLFGLGVF